MTRQRAGAIVNISSVSGRTGRAFDAAYCASKFGVIGLSESLAEEVRQYGIRVSVVLPDAVDTPMWDQNLRIIPRPPHLLRPERVAQLILILLTLPADTILVNPVIAPFQGRRRKPRPASAEDKG
jgi:NAD(P)-dependent dehydrogenase (short-subunit alcohol dehydrogenase family)